MLNKVTFIGHLGRDPESRALPNGTAVCNFSVASSEKWKDKNTGAAMERTEWLRCNTFEKLAEICGQYLTKGSLVYVEGALQTRKWVDKDGIEKFSTECKVSTMKMLGGKTESAQGTSEAPAARRAAPAPAQAARRAAAPPPANADGWPDEDIPF